MSAMRVVWLMILGSCGMLFGDEPARHADETVHGISLERQMKIEDVVIDFNLRFGEFLARRNQLPLSVDEIMAALSIGSTMHLRPTQLERRAECLECWVTKTLPKRASLSIATEKAMGSEVQSFVFIQLTLGIRPDIELLQDGYERKVSHEEANRYINLPVRFIAGRRFRGIPVKSVRAN
jgi:hypothetical protein